MLTDQEVMYMRESLVRFIIERFGVQNTKQVRDIATALESYITGGMVYSGSSVVDTDTNVAMEAKRA